MANLMDSIQDLERSISEQKAVEERMNALTAEETPPQPVNSAHVSLARKTKWKSAKIIKSCKLSNSFSLKLKS